MTRSGGQWGRGRVAGAPGWRTPLRWRLHDARDGVRSVADAAGRVRQRSGRWRAGGTARESETVQGPEEMYELSGDGATSGAEQLVVALDGFIDAGNVVSGVVSHLRDSLPHEIVASFDLDALLDYRSRRPRVRLEDNVVTDVRWRQLVLERFGDLTGAPFLLLHGPEPDRAWQALSASLVGLAARLGVTQMVGLLALPSAAPHTRPITFIGTATRAGLLRESWPRFQAMEVPGALVTVLEHAFGSAGRDAVTVVAQVPNYLAQADVPHAGAALVQEVGRLTSLSLPVDGLLRAAERLDIALVAELAQSPENQAMVAELERQYDAQVAAAGESAVTGPTVLPSGDELARQFQTFLAEREDGH